MKEVIIYLARVYIFQRMDDFYQLEIARIPLGREDTFQLIITANPSSRVWRFVVFLHDEACFITL